MIIWHPYVPIYSKTTVKMLKIGHFAAKTSENLVLWCSKLLQSCAFLPSKSYSSLPECLHLVPIDASQVKRPWGMGMNKTQGINKMYYMSCPRGWLPVANCEMQTGCQHPYGNQCPFIFIWGLYRVGALVFYQLWLGDPDIPSGCGVISHPDYQTDIVLRLIVVNRLTVTQRNPTLTILDQSERFLPYSPKHVPTSDSWCHYWNLYKRVPTLRCSGTWHVDFVMVTSLSLVSQFSWREEFSAQGKCLLLMWIPLIVII